MNRKTHFSVISLLILCSSANAQLEGGAKSVVCIYRGPGVTEKSAKPIIQKLQEIEPKRDIRVFTKPQELLEFIQTQEAPEKTCFVFPGGHTPTMVEGFGELKKEIKNGIRDSVEKGSNYIGICNGANYACSGLLDERNCNEPRQSRVDPDDLLKMLPVNSCFLSHSRTESEMKIGRWVTIQEALTGKSFSVFWYQGSYYEIFGGGVRVLAQYPDSLKGTAPSAVCCRPFGETGGTVVGCAFHPEQNSDYLQAFHQGNFPKPKDLENDTLGQARFMEEILKITDLIRQPPESSLKSKPRPPTFLKSHL